MTKKDKYAFVIDYFSKQSPNAETELIYDNPFQLLTAVILSAQCTDKRVNATTPILFERFPDANTMAQANFEELFSIIKSISYPNSKTKYLIGMAKMIFEKFDGEIPMTVEQLVQLPGVGRKTANVITSVIDNQPNMAVDTHVFRVSNRIGLTLNSKTPLQTEKELIKHIPKMFIYKAHHWLILHGRYVCVARNPKCNICGLTSICNYYKKEIKNKMLN
ncbi:MAG: endonuclease III [Chitinophagaceae bacterium]|nr:MAG: endonuclease III [Bacteroidetes bacterium OLB11]MCC6448790.1 endonuclease III [Chitinophagaceae bacterium]